MMSSGAPDAALRLAAIVESSDDAIVSKDLNGVITSWNQAARKIFGWEEHEVIGRPITIIIPSDRLSEEDTVLSRIRRGLRVEHFETVRCRKDGSLVDVSVTVSPIRDADGVIVGASKIARDVTERKGLDRELRDVRQRLLGLTAASASILGAHTVDAVVEATIELAREAVAADGYALWRCDAQQTWKLVRAFGISDAFARMADVIATSAADGGAADDRQRSGEVPFSEPLIIEDVMTEPLVAPWRDAYQREGVSSMVVFPLAIRGERTGAMALYSRRRRRFRDVDLEVGGALSNLAAAALTAAELYDEQRKAREAADSASRQATFLAEASTILSGSLDYEDTLAGVARLAVPTIADWCTIDIVEDDGTLRQLAVAHVDPTKVEYARTLEKRYPSDPNARGGVHEVIRTGQPAFMSRIPAALLEAAARDDEHRRIITALQLTSYMCVPMLAHGRAFGAITFVSAESGREYSEADLRFAREIAARASLAAENAKAYARANEANRLKDEFLATLSHELRTPLNAVLGYARMLRLGTLAPQKVQPALEVVERNASALKQIIEDVLDISRIVSGRLRLSIERVDLPAVLRESHATVVPAADAKGVDVELLVDPQTPTVSGDRDRLQQVVWNLMSNAIKFTPRGGTVQVGLARVNSHAEIKVSDTGQGITADFLPFVFDRFRQANATFAREHGGLGLGLSIAKQLVELHGGTIEVFSKGRGEGTTFTVKLPIMIVDRLKSETSPRIQPRADHEPVALETIPRLDGVRVLAVDDELDSLSLLREVLEGAGATVTTVGSGPHALDALSRGTVDVMVADVGMPGMDGLQLMRAIRQMEEPNRSLPAAALTAYARSHDRVTSLASGFQMHLVKPIDPLELIVAISALVLRRID